MHSTLRRRVFLFDANADVEIAISLPPKAEAEQEEEEEEEQQQQTTTTTTTKKKAEDDALSGRCIQLVDDDRAVDEDEAWEEEQVDARRAKRGRRGKPTTKRLVGDRENKRAKQKTDPLCNRVPITKRNTPRDILFGRSL